MTRSRYEAKRQDFQDFLVGEPTFRADQLFDGLWTRRAPLEDILELPAPLRESLDAQYPLALDVAMHLDGGDTEKWLWHAQDGAQIETVLMHYPDRATVCVSSQAGCAMGCTFCATGQAGFERHLRSEEILEQVIRAQHVSKQRVSNVVFMGMGEPLANVEPVVESCARLISDFGISARNITVSTVGVVPGIRQLATQSLPITLAVSLHAPNDELRAHLVPLNRRYRIKEVLEAAADYSQVRKRRVTFEYALISEVNDSPDLATELALLLRDFPGAGGAHVNLIPLNPTVGFEGTEPSHRSMQRFSDILQMAGISATVRTNRGVNIDAACGQLHFRTLPAKENNG